MALRLTLVCHAATRAQKTARFPADDPVAFDGPLPAALQAIATGKRTRFMHAPEARARQTAERLSARSECVDALRDLDFGRWRGLSIDEVASAEPEALQAWLTGREVAPHGGETLAQLSVRVEQWMSQLAGEGHIVAVTHPSVMRAALMRVLSCPPQAFHTIDIAPLSTLDLRFNGVWRLRL